MMLKIYIYISNILCVKPKSHLLPILKKALHQISRHCLNPSADDVIPIQNKNKNKYIHM